MRGSLSYCAVSSAVLLFAMGCQTYDFEPVAPAAINQRVQTKVIKATVTKPNLMLVVDRSGSMSSVVTGMQTRMSQLKDTMSSFLDEHGTVARMGMTAFPLNGSTEQGCAPPTQGNILNQLPTTDDDAVLAAAASSLKSEVLGLSPAGGTPTNRALAEFVNYSLLTATDRDNFILLLTDGIPNCNPNNTHDWSVNKADCNCTLRAAQTSQGSCESNGGEWRAGVCYNCGDSFWQRRGCLDKDGSVATIQQLLSKKIKTIVVGFGADTAEFNAAQSLSAMAEAGGFPRSCQPGDTSCTKYYQAANGDELAQALEKIIEDVTAKPCEQRLETAPTDPAFLSVLVDGQPVARGADTWTYDPAELKILFQGALCSRLEATTPDNPISIEYRIVQAL